MVHLAPHAAARVGVVAVVLALAAGCPSLPALRLGGAPAVGQQRVEAGVTLSGHVTGPADLAGGSMADLARGAGIDLARGVAPGPVREASAYRIAEEQGGQTKIAGGFVYLTDASERLYADPQGRLYGTLTDDDGKFDLAAPATNSLIVNVLLRGNRRLTALADTTGRRGPVAVNVATTLVTEFLRARGIQFGFGFPQVMESATAADALAAITRLTADLLPAAPALKDLSSEELTLNRLPQLRQRYALAIGTASDQALSDQWVHLMRAVKNDPLAPDVKYRTVALSGALEVPQNTLADQPVMAPDGTLYFAGYDGTFSMWRARHEQSAELLYSEGPAYINPNTLLLAGYAIHMLADGRILYLDGRYRVLVFDPAKSVPLHPDLSAEGIAAMTNPVLLFDAGTLQDSDDLADAALDDKPDPGLYLTDKANRVVWYLPEALKGRSDALAAPFAGSPGVATGESDPVPAATLAALRFNQPSGVVFHRHAGVPYLYVADAGDQVVVEINVDSGAVRGIAGALPQYNEGEVRDFECQAPGEDGVEPLEAHLNEPNFMRFDRFERLVLSDRSNGLIRMITVYDAEPRIWTVAGVAVSVDDQCGGRKDLPFSAFESSGDARTLQLGIPNGINFDNDGNLLVGDWIDSRLMKIWLGAIKG